MAIWQFVKDHKKSGHVVGHKQTKCPIGYPNYYLNDNYLKNACFSFNHACIINVDLYKQIIYNVTSEFVTFYYSWGQSQCILKRKKVFAGINFVEESVTKLNLKKTIRINIICTFPTKSCCHIRLLKYP